jgi:hypothetical protein
MKGLVHRILRRRVIGLTILLICLLSAKTHPSTDKPETYVSRSEYSNLLFAQQMEDSVRVERVDSVKLKDPKMAVVYAIIPGVVVHGSGHFYAGKKTTGWMLVAGEILSIGMVTYSIGAGFAEAMGGSNSDVDYEIVGVAGVTLFVGTWIYDIIGAPLAVQKHNQKFLEKENVGLEFDFDPGSEVVKLQIVKRF